HLIDAPAGTERNHQHDGGCVESVTWCQHESAEPLLPEGSKKESELYRSSAAAQCLSLLVSHVASAAQQHPSAENYEGQEHPKPPRGRDHLGSEPCHRDGEWQDAECRGPQER